MLSILDNSLRAVNFVFLIIVLGLTGSLIHGQRNSHSRVNFGLFTAVFALVTDSFYSIVANFISAFAWPIITIALDVLNLIFTFAAATALGQSIGAHSCSNRGFLDGNTISEQSTDRCRKVQASSTFLFFSFFIFLAKAVFSGLNIFSSGAFSSGGSKRGGGVPTISQV
ncbi:AFR312Wp [Eremothecium gossypii ATCC 10895]|uniref:AFR312Wp n=1 Tax=Eremothecium gossypii (strain ATCC 10895 / CBS 109.51 / FGSC 9923 / NRRL Y-1056) TaxID=284811 RepID=Q753K0_EREGS|nr:AFR312Wp [Eremothecium gossypii ATCC 10895]AAS53683.1 AFR312Wp [Eremothecium gossypii ATCC 10895]AEY97996.1 FAFR312Wp [Eremothecium gossypii FDAG1]